METLSLAMPFTVRAQKEGIVLRDAVQDKDGAIAGRPPSAYNAPPMSKQKNAQASGGTIALNKKAKHDYFIEERFEAGVSLTGWEVKSLRAGKSILRGRTEAFSYRKPRQVETSRQHHAVGWTHEQMN